MASGFRTPTATDLHDVEARLASGQVVPQWLVQRLVKHCRRLLDANTTLLAENITLELQLDHEKERVA